MPLNKLTLIREFGLGVGMTLFLCLAPQASAFWTGALFVGMFTIYETFPDFHWCPAWTAFKILDKQEDIAQGTVRIFVQVFASILAAIVGYQLNDNESGVYFPMFTHVDEWRSLVWIALVWAAWIGLVHHTGGQDKDGFRRSFALTATFVSANYMLQGVGAGHILNTGVNVGRLIGAKIFFDGQKDAVTEVTFKKLWIVLLGPAIGVVLAWVALWCDAAIAAWDAPPAGDDETTAVYGSTGNNDGGAKPRSSGAEIALSPADDVGDKA